MSNQCPVCVRMLYRQHVVSCLTCVSGGVACTAHNTGDFDVNIYVGNLSYRTGDEDLRQAFAQYGEVTSARVITDRETGRSRGFGFAEMANDDEGRAAIAGLDGKDLGGRTLRINEARPREEQAPQRRGGGGGGGGGGARRW